MSAVRGLVASASGDRLYAVVDNALYEVASNGDRTSRGTLVTHRGSVDMKIGETQLVIVDGANGYAYDLETKVFTQITGDGWLGSVTVAYLDGYYAFHQPGTFKAYISAIEDALTLDVLDFVEIHGVPGNIVALVADHGELYIFKDKSIEVWQDSGGADFPLRKNPGADVQVGCMAAFTAKPMDNAIFWLGRDQSGEGIVYQMRGYQAQRISTMAVEEKIQAAIAAGHDVSKAVAYAYQQNGHSFYCLQVPGVETTWVFDAASGQWHERAELVLGEYEQHRGRYHAYAHAKHIIGGDDGILYAYDVEADTNAGDVLVRDRVSPHYATPQLQRIAFPSFELDCTVGKGKAGQAEAKVMLRYSNDGGVTWSDWRTSTLGAVGQTTARARFLRCGAGRDRVWQVRCTDDVPFAIIAADVEAA